MFLHQIAGDPRDREYKNVIDFEMKEGKMIKAKKIILLIVTSIIVFIFVYKYYTSNYSNEGIINKVIDIDGYSLSLESKQIPLEVFIKPEWIAFNQDERKEVTSFA